MYKRQEEELSHSGVAEEYRRFCYRFREEYIYEMLRLSREVTSFRTLEMCIRDRATTTVLAEERRICI